MKNLIVVTKSELGGAQSFVLNLARGLVAAGEEVIVAGGPGEYLPEELARHQIHFHRFQKLTRSRNPLKILGFVKELRTYVAAEKFSVVHLNSSNALAGVWGLHRLNPRPKIIFTVHGLSLLDGGHKLWRPLKGLYRSFFKKAFQKLDKIVFVSQLNLDYAQDSGLLEGVTEKALLIHNGLDFPADYLLSREAARTALGLEANAYIYGSIGRLAYPKNYEFLINNHKSLSILKPQAQLVIIGEGPERGKYENLIDLYGLSNEIKLVGELKDASRYLKAFDLFVLPSVFEGLSLSLIEAHQAGVPAIASRVGGNEEVIGPKACFILGDKDDYLRLVKNHLSAGQESDFSGRRMVKKYHKLYHS